MGSVVTRQTQTETDQCRPRLCALQRPENYRTLPGAICPSGSAAAAAVVRVLSTLSTLQLPRIESQEGNGQVLSSDTHTYTHSRVPGPPHHTTHCPLCSDIEVSARARAARAAGHNNSPRWQLQIARFICFAAAFDLVSWTLSALLTTITAAACWKTQIFKNFFSLTICIAALKKFFAGFVPTPRNGQRPVSESVSEWAARVSTRWTVACDRCDRTDSLSVQLSVWACVM